MVILGIVYHWVDYIQYLDMEKNIKKTGMILALNAMTIFFVGPKKMPRSWKVKTWNVKPEKR